MSTSIRFEKLLEPGRIGSVKTRNRIIKTGAGMLMWHEDDLHMREEVKAYYESIAKEGKKATIEADTVVPALPLSANTSLLKSLEGKVPEVYAVGDCKAPLLIVDSIGTGSRVAREI